MLVLTGRVPSTLALDEIFLPSSRLALPSNAPPGLFKSIVGLASSINLTTLPFSFAPPKGARTKINLNRGALYRASWRLG